MKDTAKSTSAKLEVTRQQEAMGKTTPDRAQRNLKAITEGRTAPKGK